MIRAREFCMKDLYTFDTDMEAARHTYLQVGSLIFCSLHLLQVVKLPFLVR
jgi:prolyl-tRNA synthetase